MNYDVFISYRRDKGAMTARNLQQALSALGLKVFFDMEELTDGKFNEKLYDSIEQSKNVIFLMTEGSLTRCLNDGDWVRNELEHVIDRGINLIPIAPTGTPIAFPDALPGMRPDVFVYVTDGYGDAPAKAPPYPVMWVLTSDATEDFATWGTKLYLNPLHPML